MELNFKEQQYQIDAVQALIRCFSWQPKWNTLWKTLFRERTDFWVSGVQESDFNAFANWAIDYSVRLKILDEVQELQKEQGIPVIKTLDIWLNGELNFSVEMETWTWKTYVYTRSIFELNKQYGWSKFIIMVPSIAIREWVYKSLNITANHFQDIYWKKLRIFIYDTKNSSNLSNIKNFADSSSIEVMIMNYQAFGTNSEEGRKIYQKMDATNSIRPIDIIAWTNPILIIDEPQKFWATAENKMKQFNPLFIVRYSATHKKEYNKIYRLDAVDAYNQKLVKRIAVKWIETLWWTWTNSYMFLDRINISTTKYPTAHVRLEIESKEKGQIRKVLKELKQGDNLYEISNYMKQYDWFVINRVDAYHNLVWFTNWVEISVWQVLWNIDEEHIRRIQIRETIVEHLRKERELFHKGIKVLSLFFIDEVKKYRDYDQSDEKWTYAHLFEEEYRQALNDERELFDIDYNAYLETHAVESIHKWYFSIDKKWKFIDSKETRDWWSDDVSAYDLIMKNKERLLDFNEPTRFIFSHSALREWWDNPNIFQICTLKESTSIISKRQEIWRGLRVCVDKNWYRQDQTILGAEFFDINTLTVIASESYDSFSKQLQKEVLESLSDRPTKVKSSVLIWRVLRNEMWEFKEISEELAMDIITDMRMKGYLDKEYAITDLLIEDIDNNRFELTAELKSYSSDFASIMYKIHSTANYKATIEAISNVPHHLDPNENFKKKEFQDLWSKIKGKTSYEVDFDSDELIEHSVHSINQYLNVKEVLIKVTTWLQKEQMTQEELTEWLAMSKDQQQFWKTASVLWNIKYDLIGEICKNTNLTRKTVTAILQKIREEKFKQFWINPEDFIRQTSEFINNEKATTLINWITYSTTWEVYWDDIFTINNFSWSLRENILEVKRHIYDYVKTDSDWERRFAKELEEGEVAVYAKLPRWLLIPTPIGNYNPDRAIVMDKKDVKYVYFIAETKGSLDSMQLRHSEELKIWYARKHFEALNTENLKYDVVDSYNDLMNKVFSD